MLICNLASSAGFGKFNSLKFLLNISGQSGARIMNGLKRLNYFFKARSVAVIGASKEPGKIGREILYSLLSSGYKGKVYPINPKYEEIAGLKCYKSITEVPDFIDLAVLAIPAHLAPKIVEECGRKGVKAIVIVSGGFKEVGGLGEELEKKVSEIARRYNIRVIGPNCIGVFDGRTRIDTFFQNYQRMIRPPPGTVAFLTQSGTYGCTVLEWMAEEGIGISKFVSYGNMVDVDEAELLEYLWMDPETKIIAFYIESLKSGRRFIEVARRVIRDKPVIVLKAGRTAYGAKAAKSHTGGLAGDYMIIRGALKQAKVIMVDTLVELYDTIKAFYMSPLPKGDKIAMITNGAGPCVMAADEIEELGLQLATYSEDTIDYLKRSLPPYAQIGNPLDLTGSATTRDFMISGKALAKDPKIDILAFFFVFQDTPLEDKIVDELPKLKAYNKPIFVMAAGGPYAKKQSKILTSKGIPVYESPERLVKAIYNLITYVRYSKGS